jgi:hypothetical protein
VDDEGKEKTRSEFNFASYVGKNCDGVCEEENGIVTHIPRNPPIKIIPIWFVSALYPNHRIAYNVLRFDHDVHIPWCGAVCHTIRFPWRRGCMSIGVR